MVVGSFRYSILPCTVQCSSSQHTGAPVQSIDGRKEIKFQLSDDVNPFGPVVELISAYFCPRNP